MDPQLMGASREGFQLDTGNWPSTFQHAVTCHGGFAMLMVHPLAGAIVHIRTDGQVDNALVLLHDAIEQGDIAFTDGVILKLLLQGLV